MKTMFFAVVACAVFSIAGTSWGSVWYVNDDAAPGGLGLAWESALQTIGSAVAAAGVYDEIWVAEGTYAPGMVVELKVGQELYGGFVGNELDRLSRAAEFYPTFSGIGNGRAIVKAALSSRIDGFRILDDANHWGNWREPTSVSVNADGVTIANCTISVVEGGVALLGAGNVVENCTFTDCGRYGLEVNGSEASVIRCSFANSLVGCFVGKGVYEGCVFEGSPINIDGCDEVGFSQCSFADAHYPYYAPVSIYMAEIVSIDSCWFGGNGQNWMGGAVQLEGNTLTVIRNTTFVDNSASNMGGAVYVSAIDHWDPGSIAELLVEDCDFVGNNSTTGAAVGIVEAVASLKNCRFTDNTATSRGGAIFESNSLLTLENCLFTGNESDGSGGAVLLDQSSEASFVNCTFWGNTSGEGGILQADQGSCADVKNCIVAESTPAALWASGLTAKVNTTFSCIQGGALGAGNVTGDPLFNDPENGDFGLLWGSPCIDRGTADGAPANDLAGTARPQLAGIDMGAFEFVITDEDEDTMDDNWELYYGLDPADPGDAEEDADGDGVTNAQEAAIRNNPQEPDDCRDAYYVATDGNDTDGEGSELEPWATIGKAMAYAGGFSMYKAVNIYAAGGTYNEPVVLEPEVALIGAGQGITRIEYMDVAEDEHYVVTGAEGAALRDCTIEVTGQYSASFALLKLDDVSMEIQDVTFDGDDNLYSLGALISGTGSSETVIDGCTFRRLYFGVQAVNTAANVTNTTFSGIRGDAIFVRLPDVKKNGEVVYTPLLGDAAYADTTGNNMFRNVMGNFVLNMNNVTTKAENNDWGVYTDTAIAAQMAGPVDYKPYVGEQVDDGTDGDGDNGGCFAADKSLPMRTSRGDGGAFVMLGVASCLAVGSRRKKQ
ncbi:MAG: right-handed parallel beta-helix repeat-containing protein [Candidatus Hydrogenedentes bacterium]|nr:right-handed parallel beta-helix repeat-containing protein [Candidatus Hydrogenedentota bacterium]